MTNLPKFKYHPNPLATESVIASDLQCACCGLSRGYIYSGPVYAIGYYNQKICPWCIDDGSASLNLDATFTDEDGIGGYGEWDAVAESVVRTVATRTPGFNGWQQERWWTHCGDAAMFLGQKGFPELEKMGGEAIESFKRNTGLDAGKWQGLYRRLNKNGSPTAYLFQCVHCGAVGGYHESH